MAGSKASGTAAGWVLVLRLLGGALVVAWFSRLLLVSLAQQVTRHLGACTSLMCPWGIALLSLAVQLVLAGYIAATLRVHRGLHRSVRASLNGSPRQLALSVVVAVSAGPLANACALGVGRFLRVDSSSMYALARIVHDAGALEFAALVLCLSLAPALVEETLFRGLVLSALSPVRPAVAIAVQAIAFGVFHLDLVQGIATCLLGLAFGTVRYKTGSLVAAMAAHGAYNLAVLVSLRLGHPTEPAKSALLLEVGIGAAIALFALRALGTPTRSDTIA